MSENILQILGSDETGAPASVALVIVDMQYFDAHRDWGEGRTANDLGVAQYFDEYFERIDEIIPRIADLAARFREKSMEVIHLRVAELTQDSRDVGYKQIVRGLIVPSDSMEAEFLPLLEPAADEIIVSKSSSGVFAVTSFDRTLRNLGIETLIFAGTSTGGCVQSAVYDATDLNYNVMVVEDACADATGSGHDAAVAALAAQATEIITCADLQDALDTLPDVDPKTKSGRERVLSYTLSEPHIPDRRDSKPIEPYSTIFGPAIQLAISPATTALMIVDAQRLACDPAFRPDGLMPESQDFTGYYERASAALSRMSELLQACRELHVPILHIRTASQIGDGRDLSVKRRKQGVTAAVGSTEAEFMPEVLPAPGEAVINKPSSSVFNGTGLDTLLANMDTSNLILVGASLDGTLESSMRSAGDRGYGIILAHDACVAAASIEVQLKNSEHGIINVRSVDGIISLLRGPASEQRH